jgi:hypothetical protein
MRVTLRRLFAEHPASIGETYTEHARHAAGFGASMLMGALACFVHAVVPGVCTTTGSRMITRLYDRMVVNRSGCPMNRSSATGQSDFLAEDI